MQKNKAVQILRTLNPDEFKRFEKFIRSPYFNNSSQVTKLFSIIKKYYPDFKNEKLNIKEIYKKLYPSQNYHDGKIRNIVSELNSIAENFLMIEFYKEDEFMVNYGKINAFDGKKLEDLRDKLIDKVLEENKKVDALVKENYRFLMKLIGIKIRTADETAKAAKYVTKLSEYQTVYFLSEALPAKHQTIVSYNNFNVRYSDISVSLLDSIDLDKFLDKIKKDGTEFYQIIEMEICLHRAFTGENINENISKFEEIFNKIYPLLDKDYAGYTLKVYYNVCMMKMQAAPDKEEEKYYKKKLFDAFVFSEKEGIFKLKGFLRPSLISMVSNISTNIKEFEWTLKFLDTYGKMIPENLRDEKVNLCKAELYTVAEDYEKALHYCSLVIKPNFYSLWFLKILLTKIHYSLGNYETVLSLCDSALTELKRKYKDNPSRKKNVEYFNFMNKLTKIKLNDSKDGLSDLKMQITNSKYYDLNKEDFLAVKIKEIEQKFYR